LGGKLSDGVHLSASLNVYRGQGGSGAGDVTNIGQYSQNLWYLDPALKAHVVTEGETLYLMVTAGGLRGISAVSVEERSNIVAFTASSSPKTFTFSDTPPTPPQPGPQPPVDQSAILARLDTMAKQQRDDTAQILAAIDGLKKSAAKALAALAILKKKP